MASTLADFLESGTAESNDWIVGYDNTNLGGERRWQLSTIANAVSGIIQPSITTSIRSLSGIEIVSPTEKKATLTYNGGNLTLDLSSASIFYINLNANIGIGQFILTNIPASPKAFSFTLQFIADGTLRSVIWPTGTKWGSGIAPTLTSTNGKVDTFTFLTHDGGINWFAFISDQNH